MEKSVDTSTPVSEEIDGLILNHFPSEEAGNVKPFGDIREEHANIKLGSEDHEIKHISSTSFKPKQNQLEPQLDILKVIKSEKNLCILDFSNTVDLKGSSDCSPKELEVPIKTETTEIKSEIEEWPEISYGDRKIENGEFGLKAEDLLENKVSVSSVDCTKEKNVNYKKFKCDECDYQTKRKDHLKQHLLRHKNPDEVDLFRCDKCAYQTPCKKYLNTHALRHGNPNENLFKCDKCEYQNYIKDNLKKHMFSHKNLEEVNLFTCDKCEYRTRYRSTFKVHVLRHKEPKELDLFKCDKCEYRTSSKPYLKSHLLKHKSIEEVTIYKCDTCKFETRYKNSIKDHMLRHKNPEEVELFKCGKCEYRTRVKGDLYSHWLVHKNIKAVVSS